MPVSGSPATPATAPASTRPPMPWLDEDKLAALDWLAANGIDEPIPDDVVIVIDSAGEIAYTAYAFVDDVRTWTGQLVLDADLEVIVVERSVPLLVEPGFAALRGFGAQLRVRGDFGPTS